jgi:hypothetical protein
MTDFANQLDPILVEMWAQFSEDENYRSMLDSVIGSYLLFRSLPDGDQLSLHCIVPLSVAADALAKQNGLFDDKAQIDVSHSSTNCSFCGKVEPPEKLAAGPNVKICEECVTMLYKHFKR